MPPGRTLPRARGLRRELSASPGCCAQLLCMMQPTESKAAPRDPLPIAFTCTTSGFGLGPRLRYPISCSCRSLREHSVTARLRPPTPTPRTVVSGGGGEVRRWEGAGATGAGLQEGVPQEGWGGTCLRDGIPATASPRRSEGRSLQFAPKYDRK